MKMKQLGQKYNIQKDSDAIFEGKKKMHLFNCYVKKRSMDWILGKVK